MTAAAERLRRLILERGPMPFAEFMAEALYGENGYYARESLAIGEGGDFLTGSSCSPLFPRVTAGLVRLLDEALGRPADVVEVGPGNGEHLRQLVEALRDGPPRRFLANDRRHRSLPAEVEFVADLQSLPEVRGLIFSYEVFDAQPVHRVTASADGSLGELGVDLAGEGFAWRAMPLSDRRLADWLERAGVALEPGQVADVSLEWDGLYRTLASRLREGLLVTCDYGFETASLFDPRVRRHGTLAAYRGHRVHRDALRSIGEQDLTAHVDFGLLRRVGEAEGLATVGIFPQALFLTAAGLFAELAADPARIPEAHRLLDGEGMGGAIRVLVQARAREGQSAMIRFLEGAFKSSNSGSKTP